MLREKEKTPITAKLANLVGKIPFILRDLTQQVLVFLLAILKKLMQNMLQRDSVINSRGGK